MFVINDTYFVLLYTNVLYNHTEALHDKFKATIYIIVVMQPWSMRSFFNIVQQI